MSPFLQKYLPYLILVCTAILFVITILPSDMGYDEGMWFYQARLWIDKGMPPYQFSIENKTPGIFYIFSLCYAIAPNSIWLPKVIGIIATLLTSFVIYKILEKLISVNAGLYAQIVFGLFSSCLFVQGYWVQHPESYMILFTSIAFYFLIKGYQQGGHLFLPGHNVLWSGVFMGLSVIFKQVAVFSAFAFFIFLIFFSIRNREYKNNLYKLLALFTGGMVLSYVFFSLPVLLSHVSVYTYLQNTWIILFDGRMTLKPTMSGRINEFFRFFGGYEIRFIFLTFLVFLFRKKYFNPDIFRALAFWLILDTLATFSSGYYYAHQLKQLLPTFSIIMGLFLFEIQRCLRVRFLSLFMIVVLLFFPYENLFSLVHSVKTFSSVRDYEELGYWIKLNSNPEDPVLIWGGINASRVLAFSERSFPGKYFDLAFLGNDKSLQEFHSDMIAHKPLYILHPVNPDDGALYIPKPEWLDRFIHENYTLLSTRNGYLIYKFSTNKP